VEIDKPYHHDLTALMWAAGYGKTQTVKLLLDRGADRGLKDDRGKTAAEIARDAKYSEVAELLGKP
jgi:ankyrin repeat protein